MHGPRNRPLPKRVVPEPAAPEIKPLTINVGQAPDGRGGTMVVVEVSLGTGEGEVSLTGALHPRTACALGVELQRLGSAGQLAVARSLPAS